MAPATQIANWGPHLNLSARHCQVGPCQVFVEARDSVSSVKLEKLTKDCDFDFQPFVRRKDTAGPIGAFGLAFGDLSVFLAAEPVFLRGSLVSRGGAAPLPFGFKF